MSVQYDQGQQALRAGKLLRDNPYGPKGSAYVSKNAAMAWRMGYLDAKAVDRFLGSVKVIDPQSPEFDPR